ncbi:hypothetical protein [Nitrosococcus wardiae]|uniref:Uncharacterized protein n=1 Tax=Nitrosococcus wardiae TaxID=1814290 RepID=A0A4P7C0I8_9GAMM|nr:hypothetical protein [Nitrosococcus wardiae]QBQ56088.1 hypothetical protein E3U44_17405 [Nitrosococcus wardiae]
MKTNIKHIVRRTLLAAVLSIIAVPAQAYVGPGAGLSLLGALWALVAAIAAAVGFIVLWPIRKMMKRKAAEREASDKRTP